MTLSVRLIFVYLNNEDALYCLLSSCSVSTMRADMMYWRHMQVSSNLPPIPFLSVGGVLSNELPATAIRIVEESLSFCPVSIVE